MEKEEARRTSEERKMVREVMQTLERAEEEKVARRVGKSILREATLGTMTMIHALVNVPTVNATVPVM